MRKRNTVLTIAGTDSSGGAGISADLKTFAAHGVYGMNVITAVTAQNTLGVTAVQTLNPEMIAAQIDCVFTDIPPDAVKIGMVSDAKTVQVIAEGLLRYQAKQIVLDTVMISTSGHRLIEENAQELLVKQLIPLADLITPNIPEAQCLSGLTIDNQAGMLRAAETIASWYSGAILIKGGHLSDCADDLLYCGRNAVWYPAPRIHSDNTHGTGCTLSSAIAVNLAQGQTIEQAVYNAKTYVENCLRSGLCLGKGSGSLDHCYAIPGMGCRQ